MYYCMVLIYFVANTSIQRHVTMTNVTRTVTVSKCTS